MGGCVSKQSSTLKESSARISRERPFFRQESQCGPLHNNDSEDPWKERITYEDPSEDLLLEDRETVLHTAWWKHREHKDEQPQTEGAPVIIEPAFIDDDAYDHTNEHEMEQEFPLNKKKGIRLPPLPKVPKFKRQPKTELNYINTSKCIPTRHNDKATEPKDADTDKPTTERNKLLNQATCFEYREMVKIFKPLIVQNLLVHDILPYLPFLEDHDDIYEEMKIHSRKHAVESLLTSLEKSEKQGKWQIFIDALSSHGYTYIVDNIRGYRFINHLYQKQYLITLIPTIGKMITSCELLPHLLAKDLIGDNDQENIQREDTNHGNFAANVMMLDRITRKNSNWYLLFIEALHEADMEEVAANLQIPELLENKREKVTDDYSYNLPPYPCDKTTSLSSSVESPRIGQIRGETDGIIRPRSLFPPPPITASTSEYHGSYQYSLPMWLSQRPPLALPASRPVSSVVRNNIYDYTSIEEDDNTDYGGYELYEAPVPSPINTSFLCPTVPPRVQVNGKRKVPVPIWTKEDSDQFRKEQIECEQNINTLQNSDYQTFDDFGILAITSPDIEHNGGLDNERCIDTSKFQDLFEDIAKMKIETSELHFEIELLETKSTLHEEANTGLRKRRELKEAIVLKEKERIALQSDNTIVGEKSDLIYETDAYYPTKTRNNNGGYNKAYSITPCSKKTTLVYRDPIVPFQNNFSSQTFAPLSLDSAMSTVEVYSPKFAASSIISQMFDKDSGIGAELEYT